MQDALNSLSQMTQLSRMGQLQADAGGNDGSAVADEDDQPQTLASATPFNPFDTPETAMQNNRFSWLDGELSEGVEVLLPNPVTRYKLAYNRVSARVETLLSLQQTLDRLNCPELLSMGLRLSNQLDQNTQRLQIIEHNLSTAATQKTGRLGTALMNGVEWATRTLKTKAKPLKMKVSDATVNNIQQLWQFAQTPAEQVALWHAVARLK